MPYNWDDVAEKRLMLTMLATLNVSGFDWVAIANQMGGGLSKDAVRSAFPSFHFHLFPSHLSTITLALFLCFLTPLNYIHLSIHQSWLLNGTTVLRDICS